MRAPHQTREAWLGNPGCFTSSWLIIYGRWPFLHKQQHKRTVKPILSQLYSGKPPSKAFHTVCSSECVPVARLAVICTVVRQHKTAHHPSQLSLFNKECLLTMQQFDALFIFLCPLEAEATHLQTQIHKDTKGVSRWASHLIRISIGRRHWWALIASVQQEMGHWHMDVLQAGRRFCVCECILPYREHGGGEKTPCKKLQEDDHHSMVNTGLADSLRLRGDKQRGS